MQSFYLIPPIGLDNAELAHGLQLVVSSAVEARDSHPIQRTCMQEVVHAGKQMG
jgi:hypothetical protein